jgi:hypothetical protein
MFLRKTGELKLITYHTPEVSTYGTRTEMLNVTDSKVYHKHNNMTNLNISLQSPTIQVSTPPILWDMHFLCA